MNVFVVTKDVITDVAGEVIDSGSVCAVFYSVEKANEYIDGIKETYTHKKTDYEITELTVE